MKSKILAIFLAITVGLTLLLAGCGDSKQAADVSSSSASSSVQAASSGSNNSSSSSNSAKEDKEKQDNKQQKGDLYFRNKKLLDQHYEKHGREMGFKSAKEYEAAASQVVNNPKALHKLEKDQDKGNTVYYIEKTNEFVVVSADGFIRTYFNPSGGKAYYDRQ